MNRHIQHIGTLTIANTGTDSNVITDDAWKHAVGFMFDGGGTGFTGTVSFIGKPTVDTTFANLRPVFLNSVAQVINGNGLNTIMSGGMASIAAESSGAEGAERTIEVYAIFEG